MQEETDIRFNFKTNSPSIIKVIGVGGGGGNAVNHMYKEGIHDVSFVLCNTDNQALSDSPIPTRLQLGTEGLGAGNRPERARQAAMESLDGIKEMLNDGTRMVFITAGMGGGTGTGAAPVIAQCAKEMGILTVGIVTKPFLFEGKRRMVQAEAGITNLRDYVDALIIIPNERLKQVGEKITLMNAFQVSDDVLRHGVQSITELINVPGYINLDFADVTSILKDAGYAHMGVGEATGKDKAETAAKMAISSPLLETSICGSKGIIINITASPDISMDDIDIAASLVTSEAHEDATVIFGVVFDPDLEDTMKVTIIATGSLVALSISAANGLAKEGISVRVIDMHTIKPLDKDAIVKAAKETGHIITAEDHLITGGLGSAVAETLADAGIGVPFRRLGIPGEDFPPLGDCYELYAHFGYNPEGIKRAVRELLGK